MVIKLGGGSLWVKAGGGSSEDGDTIDYNQPPLFPIFYNQPPFSPSLMLSKLIVLFTCSVGFNICSVNWRHVVSITIVQKSS